MSQHIADIICIILGSFHAGLTISSDLRGNQLHTALQWNTLDNNYYHKGFHHATPLGSKLFPFCYLNELIPLIYKITLKVIHIELSNYAS